MPFFSILVILCGLFQMSSSTLQCSIVNLKLGLFWLKFSDCYAVQELSELVSAQVVAVKAEKLT